jgi:hypothetical protein
MATTLKIYHFALFRIVQRLFDIENPWLGVWSRISEYLSNGQWQTFAWATNVYLVSTYWAFAGVFFAINFIPRLNIYKIQKDKKVDIAKCFKVSHENKF